MNLKKPFPTALSPITGIVIASDTLNGTKYEEGKQEGFEKGEPKQEAKLVQKLKERLKTERIEVLSIASKVQHESTSLKLNQSKTEVRAEGNLSDREEPTDKYRQSLLGTTMQASRPADCLFVDIYLRFLLKEWKHAIILTQDYQPERKLAFNSELIHSKTRNTSLQDSMTLNGRQRVVVLNVGYDHTPLSIVDKYASLDVTSISVYVQNMEKGQQALVLDGKKNLRFPIFARENQLISDNEYVYILERAILPIVADVNPDIVCVNFDAEGLLGEYRELFMFHRFILSYMLLRIRKLRDSNVVLFFNGLDDHSLLQDMLPEIASVLNEDLDAPEMVKTITACDEMFKYAIPTEIFVTTHTKVLEAWEKHYPVLSNEELVAYDNLMRTYIEKERYLAGGHQDKLEINGDFLFKTVKENEFIFYKEKYPNMPQIHPLLPEVYEIIQVNEKQVIKFENLTKNGDFNMIDLKLTNDKNKRNVASEFYSKYFFYIPGYVIKDPQGNVIEKRFKFSKRINERQIRDMFKRFFGAEDAEKTVGKVKKVIEFIEQSYKVARDNSYNWAHASYLLLYDRNTGKVKVRLIDMTYFSEGSNEQTLNSIKGLLRFLTEFVEELVHNL